MKTTIRISNPSLQGNQYTQLANDSAVGATTLYVLSTVGFNAITSGTPSTHYYILIGNYGEEKSEIVLASNLTDSTFTVGATKYAHSASDKITFIPYNQIKLYGRTTSGGTNVLVDTKNIDCTQQFTTLESTDSIYGYFVSTYYRSATTAEESDFSEEIGGATFSYFSVKKIIESGVTKAVTKVDENQNGILNWSTLIDFVNEGLLEIMNAKSKWDFLNYSTILSTTAGVEYVSKPGDCASIEFVKYKNNKLEFVSRLRFEQFKYGQQPTNGTPQYYTIKENKIFLYPIPADTASLPVSYYKYPDTITSLGQEVPKPFATLLTYYVAAHAAWARSQEKRGDRFFGLFSNLLARAVEDYTGPLQAGDAEEIERTSIYGTDYDFDL